MEHLINILKPYNYWNKPPEYNLGFRRSFYLERLMKFTGNRLIKVITGQRRVGKSYILRQMQKHLFDNAVNGINIFHLTKELYELNEINTADKLKQLINKYLEIYKPQGKIYIFIDEIQTIKHWQKLIVSLAQDITKDFEIFISGSNSTLLSGELATLLAGRYIVLEVFPFSYSEFLQINNLSNTKENFINYITNSAMPETFHLSDKEAKMFYFQALKDTIIVRDVINRYKIKDTQLLEDLFLFLLSNIGNLISVSNIVKYYKSRNKTADFQTIANYIKYLEQAFITYCTQRKHIKTKELLGNLKKYYFTDLGFRNYLFPSLTKEFASSLENVVYIHLRRLGYKVFVGTQRNGEVDFIAEKGEQKFYIQVAYLLSDAKVIEREFSQLEKIRDAYPKLVITLDDMIINRSGIRHKQIWKFLTEEIF